MKVIAFYSLVSTVAVAIGVLLMLKNREAAQRAQEGAQQIIVYREYSRGFMDGMNSTLRHVNIVSNRFDIAPILNDMKP